MKESKNQAICEDILRLDDSIRFVGLYVDGQFYFKMKKGTNSFLTEEETRKSLIQAILRMKSRKQLSDKIGNPIQTVTQYEKLFRMTLPLDNDGLCFISTELDVTPFDISKKVLNLLRGENFLKNMSNKI